jgi:hypothetical protein
MGGARTGEVQNDAVNTINSAPTVARATAKVARHSSRQYEATRKIAARLRCTSASVVAHDDTLIRIAV